MSPSDPVAPTPRPPRPSVAHLAAAITEADQTTTQEVMQPVFEAIERSQGSMDAIIAPFQDEGVVAIESPEVQRYIEVW